MKYQNMIVKLKKISNTIENQNLRVKNAEDVVLKNTDFMNLYMQEENNNIQLIERYSNDINSKNNLKMKLEKDIQNLNPNKYENIKDNVILSLNESRNTNTKKIRKNN